MYLSFSPDDKEISCDDQGKTKDCRDGYCRHTGKNIGPCLTTGHRFWCGVKAIVLMFKNISLTRFWCALCMNVCHLIHIYNSWKKKKLSLSSYKYHLLSGSDSIFVTGAECGKVKSEIGYLITGFAIFTKACLCVFAPFCIGKVKLMIFLQLCQTLFLTKP